MTDVEIHTEVYNSAYLPYLQDQTPLQIYYGGSSSGKSVFLAERVVFDLLNGGRNYLVCRQIGKTLRGSVVQEINKVITTWGVSSLFTINKTDGTITCNNGYQCIFSGLDDVEKLKSITPAKGVITDIWVEEATEIEQASLKQLEKRLRGGSESIVKRLTLSFNPILQTHWIYQEYFSTIAWADDQKEYHSDDILILKTTYKDNKFLTKQDVERLEKEKDSYYYQVYTLGNWGVLGDVIFTNWKVMDLTEMRNQFTNLHHGLDFGFSQDPAAVPFTHYDAKNKTIYIYDELYERGLTNDVLASELKHKTCDKYVAIDKSDNKEVFIPKEVYIEKHDYVLEHCINIRPVPNQYIVCDSAEPKSIQELVNEGILARSAVKGKDSINFGIQWLQQQTIIIDSHCINAKNEISTYHWKKDKDGNAIRQPCDKNNHLIDGLRYAYEDESSGGLWLVS